MTLDLKPLFSHVDANEELYIKRLADWVAVQSVSSDPKQRDETIRMMSVAAEEVKRLGGTFKLEDLGMQDTPSGKLQLPPALIGAIGNDPAKKTICIYGHLDVQPAAKSDGWNTEPFVLTKLDGKLYGRGSTDDKAPILCVLNAIEAYQKAELPLPVNLKFIFEGMEESGSVGLDDLINSKKEEIFKDVDYVCISDNYWLGTEKPCLTYGLRGICYFEVTVTCAEMDLHSGIFGGTVHESMVDIVKLFSTLVDIKGKITIEGINSQVLPLTPEEEALYAPITFDPEEYRSSIGHNKLIHDRKEDILMHRWRYPSLSIHGFQGAFDGVGQKTVIPRSVNGKFSLRLVPNMTPDLVQEIVTAHLKAAHEASGSPNTMRPIIARNPVRLFDSVHMCPGGKPWMADFSHENYLAGRKAVVSVFGCEPDMTREGGSIPVTLTIQEASQKNVLMLPIGSADDGAHSQNEKINLSNYLNGTKLMISYFNEVSKL